jgi:hypothetical protein
VVLGCDGWDGMGVLVEYGRAILEHGVYQDLESLLVLRSGPWGDLFREQRDRRVIDD